MTVSFNCNGEYPSECNFRSRQREIYLYRYVYRVPPSNIAVTRLETLEDANSSYFRINFDSIERQPSNRGRRGSRKGRSTRGCIKCNCNEIQTSRVAKRGFPLILRCDTTEAPLNSPSSFVKSLRISRLEFRLENLRGKPDKTQGSLFRFRGKSPPEVDAKQNCRTKRYNDCPREKNIKTVC